MEHLFWSLTIPIQRESNSLFFAIIITNTLQEKRRNVDIFGVINEMQYCEILQGTEIFKY